MKSGSRSSKSSSILLDVKDVDEKIRNLQMQLMKLQECKKVREFLDQGKCECISIRVRLVWKSVVRLWASAKGFTWQAVFSTAI